MNKFLIILSILSSTAMAVETDQFHAASHVLKESSAAINAYVEDKFDTAIEDAIKKGKAITCEELADDVLTGMVGKYSISKISKFAKESPEIDRYPDDTISDKDYLKNSIYKEAGFPFTLVKISKTINVGGVYIGTDKLGHFSLVGRNYYRRYLKNLKKGMSPLEAEKDTITTGFKQEVHILGYTLGGVLSYGDLEANYQGFQFALSMCEGTDPYIIRKNNQWDRNPRRPFDIKNYINPKMDESYRPAFWKPKLWEKVQPVIKETYCDLKTSPIYVERVKMYESKVTVNKNDDYMKEFFSSRPKFDRSLEDIDKLCN